MDYSEEIEKRLKENKIEFIHLLMFDQNCRMIYFYLDNTVNNKEQIDQAINKIFVFCNELKIKNNKYPNRNKNTYNFLFLKQHEIRKLMFLSRMTNSEKNENETEGTNDFIFYSLKKIKDEKNSKHKFMHYKKIEYIANNIFAILHANMLIENSKFYGFYPFLKSDFISKHLKYVVNNRLYGLNQIIDEHLTKYEIETIDNICSKDIFDIANKTYDWNNKNLMIKKMGKKLNDEEVSKIIFSEVDFLKFKNHNKEKIIFLHSSIEDELMEKDIFKNEFIFLLIKYKKENLININFKNFLDNKFAMENFICKLVQIDDLNKAKLLEQFIGLMNFVDSEYKILLKPTLQTIENMLTNLFKSVIYILVEKEIIENEDQFNIFLENKFSNFDKSIPFFEYSSHILSYFQRNEKTLVKFISDFDQFTKDVNRNWDDIKLFVELENEFNKGRKFKYISEEIKITEYANSYLFKLDLDFYIGKLTFNNLINLIHSLEPKKIFKLVEKLNYDEANHNASTLNLFYSLFWDERYNMKDSFTSLIDLRNIISHQSSIENSSEDKLCEYEKLISDFIEDTESYTKELISYSSQQLQLNKDVQNEFNRKISEYFGKMNKKDEISRNIFVMKNFLSKYYSDIFGRNIFELVPEFNYVKNDVKEDETEMNFDFSDLFNIKLFEDLSIELFEGLEDE